MTDADPDKIMRISIEAITKPRAGMCEVMLDRWWVVDPKAEAVIFYQSSRRHGAPVCSPLCNPNESITKRLMQSSWGNFGFEVRHVPVAIIPIWTTGDYDFGYELGRLVVPDGG